MPVISYFFGIYVRMYFDDHAPPHIHVEYQGHEAFVAIETGEVIDGRLPRKAAKLVKDWCVDHRAETGGELAARRCAAAAATYSWSRQ